MIRFSEFYFKAYLFVVAGKQEKSAKCNALFFQSNS